MDIKTAFLYSNINTKIYIEQPEGIKAIRELYKVYKLNKVLYSLSNYYIFHNSKGIYIAVFINNFFIVGPSKANIFIIKIKLNKRFYITDLGPYKYYLRIEVIRD